MAIVSVKPFLLHSVLRPFTIDAGSDTTLDAANEGVGVIGTVFLPSGSGSKTLSAAGGGSIVFRVGSTVTAFANAGTLFGIQVGIVDASTGLNINTGVSGTLTGGTDTLAANTFKNVPMTSGTSTLDHGELISVFAGFVTRGGSDSITIKRGTTAVPYVSGATLSTGYPYGTANTGALAKSTNFLQAVFIFDDGTYGWIQGAELSTYSLTAQSFAANSTPDEYIATWEPQVPMQISGVGLISGNISTTDHFEIVIYSNPYTSPTVLQTITIDADQLAVAAGREVLFVSCTTFTASPGTVYGVALRPTTNNAIDFNYFNMGSGFDGLKAQNSFHNIKMASRTDQTGAFTEVQTYYIPALMVLVTGQEDGSGGSGGGGLKLVGRSGLAG